MIEVHVYIVYYDENGQPKRDVHTYEYSAGKWQQHESQLIALFSLMLESNGVYKINFNRDGERFHQIA